MNLKRGLLPSERPVELKFGAVLKNLPPPPNQFGHYNLVSSWGMLLNDKKSDCVVAGAAHETMLLSAMGGRKLTFSDEWVLKDYLAMQGNPWWPFNDRGLDMEKAADYRRRIGIHDARGIRHRIDAYALLRLSDPIELMQAIDLLGVAGIGLNLPANAESAWASHQPWTDTSQPPSGEGHYVCGVGRNSQGQILVVTWGRIQAMSLDYYSKYNAGMISLAYLSREQLDSKGLSPDQYDVAKLNNFLRGLT